MVANVARERASLARTCLGKDVTYCWLPPPAADPLFGIGLWRGTTTKDAGAPTRSGWTNAPPGSLEIERAEENMNETLADFARAHTCAGVRNANRASGRVPAAATRVANLVARATDSMSARFSACETADSNTQMFPGPTALVRLHLRFGRLRRREASLERR